VVAERGLHSFLSIWLFGPLDEIQRTVRCPNGYWIAELPKEAKDFESWETVSIAESAQCSPRSMPSATR